MTLVPLPAINAESSLRKGQVDAAYMTPTAKEFALERSGLKNLVTDIDLVGPYNGGSYVLRDEFIAENPKVTKKFVAALAKTIEYTTTHSVEEVKKTTIDYLTKKGRGDQAKALELWRGTGIASKGGLIGDEDFDLWLDWLESEGEVKAAALKAGDIYTNKFNPYAEEK